MSSARSQVGTWGPVSVVFALALALMLLPRAGSAQMQSTSGAASRTGVELTALYGWQFGGSVDLTTGGELELKDADAFSFLLGVPIQTPETQIELSYSYQGSEVTRKDYWQTAEEFLFEAGVHYFQIGGLRGVRKDKLMPFGYGSLGATLFDPKSDGLDSEWRFSMTLGVGAKMYSSEKLGIRAQFGVLLPFQWSGGTLWCGSGGCTGTVSGGTTIVQGNVSGGLIYTF